MKTEDLRVAKTESLFRDVNERIAESAVLGGADVADFVCECADPECGARIVASLADYERVRADGTRFLVAPGHEDTSFEEVVVRKRGFRVVAKLRSGLARAVRRLNPRTA